MTKVNNNLSSSLPLEKGSKTKSSGVSWLGDIPQEWEVWKVSRIFKIVGSGTTPNTGNRNYYENGDIKWVNTGDLNDSFLEDCEKSITELAVKENTTLRTYPKNSLIIALYGATIGKLSILNFEATVNQACCVLAKSNVAEIKFIFYWFLVNKEHIVNMAYGGGQPNISQDLVKSLKIPLPPLPTQTAIVEFLDEKTAKISEFIKNKKELIQLLKEQKKSLIYDAVTGKIGINDNVEATTVSPLSGRMFSSNNNFKPSGIPWLGDIPQDWEIRRLKQLGKVVNGSTPSSDKKEFWEGGIDWVTPTDLGKTDDPHIYESQRKITQAGLDSCGTSLVSKNSIIMSCRAPIGSLGIATKEMCTNQGCKSFIPYDFMNYKFSYYYFVGFNDYYQNLGKGTTFQELSTSDFNDSIFLLPPLPTQTAIVEFLDEKTGRIDETIATIEQEIELVEEYKKSLIYMAVTGKMEI